MSSKTPPNYWDRIPVWDPNLPRFELLSDEISGRIPVVRVEHWKHLIDLLESPLFNVPAQQYIFRGHRRYDWSLTPTLGRLTPSGIVSSQLANQQLNQFRQTIRGRITDHSLLTDEEQLDELWSIGQHHGLHTPLLDWSYSPYVALFFAFHKEDLDEEEDNAYRALYILNKTFVDEHPLCEDIRVFEPRKDDHGRLVSQAGLFLFTPPDATLENKLAEVLSHEDFEDNELSVAEEGTEGNILAKYICKIYVKNEEQRDCLRHLRRMNVHHASLFPDLIGAAEYCNTLITETHHDRNLMVFARALSEVFAKKREESGQTGDTEEHPIHAPSTLDIQGILSQHGGKEVEPGRINAIAEEVSVMLNKNKQVDWQVRESVLARMRNRCRVILRRYGYPEHLREEVVKQIIEFEMEQDRANPQTK